MLGMGTVHGTTNGTLEFAVHQEKKYPYLWDAKATLHHNEFMTAGVGNTIGPELGIGFALAKASKDPIMALKTCIGDRSLGWDLLPPGSASFDWQDPKNASLVW